MSQDSYNLLFFFSGTSLFPDCEKNTKFSHRPAKILCLGSKCIWEEELWGNSQGTSIPINRGKKRLGLCKGVLEVRPCVILAQEKQKKVISAQDNGRWILISAVQISKMLPDSAKSSSLFTRGNSPFPFRYFVYYFLCDVNEKKRSSWLFWPSSASGISGCIMFFNAQ